MANSELTGRLKDVTDSRDACKKKFDRVKKALRETRDQLKNQGLLIARLKPLVEVLLGNVNATGTIAGFNPLDAVEEEEDSWEAD